MCRRRRLPPSPVAVACRRRLLTLHCSCHCWVFRSTRGPRQDDPHGQVNLTPAPARCCQPLLSAPVVTLLSSDSATLHHPMHPDPPLLVAGQQAAPKLRCRLPLCPAAAPPLHPPAAPSRLRLMRLFLPAPSPYIHIKPAIFPLCNTQAAEPHGRHADVSTSRSAISAGWLPRACC